jgi:hypothetical protein
MICVASMGGKGAGDTETQTRQRQKDQYGEMSLQVPLPTFDERHTFQLPNVDEVLQQRMSFRNKIWK